MRYAVALSLVLLVPLLAAGAPRAGKPMLVVAAPWTQTPAMFDVVARADGLVLRGTAVSWIIVALSERPDFASKLRRSGAWMTFDASAVPGCPDANES